MESTVKNDAPAGFDAYANIRADSYAMLGSLLCQPPSKDLLNALQSLQWDEVIPEKLDHALGALRQASHDYSPATIEGEFNRLFVGLGCGEVVAYACWYREKKIQSSPLAAIRSDLFPLGIVRKAESHESEDHAGALCEIMALVSQEPNNIPTATQAGFFHRHIATWMAAFFEDLKSAKSADFYRVVGLFGSCFLESESEYLTRGSDT
jgi:TorA maturation chaperone TorD